MLRNAFNASYIAEAKETRDAYQELTPSSPASGFSRPHPKNILSGMVLLAVRQPHRPTVNQARLHPRWISAIGSGLIRCFTTRRRSLFSELLHSSDDNLSLKLPRR